MPTLKQKKTFSMGFSLLLTCATSVGLVLHVFTTLLPRGSGLFMVIAAVVSAGYLGVDYVQWFSTWWSTNETEDTAVIYVSFCGSALLAIVMVISGGAVLIRYVIEDDAAKAQQQKTAESQNQTGNEIAKANATTQAEIAAEQAFAAQLQQLRAAGLSETSLRRLMSERTKQKQNEALTRQAGQPLALLPTATPTPSQSQKPDAGAMFLGVLDSYARFWVFIVPPLIAILVKFSIVFALIKPGGASYGQTSTGLQAGALPGIGAEPDPKA